jgi:superfamily II DNA or RNA helicase
MQISQQVRVRGSRWRITDIRAYEDCQLVTLTGTGPPHGFVERQVLAPFDDIEPVTPTRHACFVRSGAWWRACRSMIAEEAPPGSLRAIHHAAIDVLAHQLEPALAVIRGRGSRVLLADEVGLGKTIQAGIIVSELRARGLAERVLVLTPAGLRDQWMLELSERFGLQAHLGDATTLRRLAGVLPLGVNPWITQAVAVASVDYIKRPEVLPAVLACAWDIVIVDEAHGAAGDSERHGAVAALASRAAYALLLTATPHSGDGRSFAALCRTGASSDNLLVFRRRRADVRGGASRKIHALRVRSSPEELKLHVLLERYVAAVRAEQEGVWLAASVLHKRALSSAWSLARSIERRLDVLARPRLLSGQQLALPLFDPDGEFSAADDEPGWPPGLSLRDELRERRLLGRILAAAQSACADESKLHALARLLRRSREPAIVFTEYRDTLLHVRSTLERPAAVLHGGMTRVERAAALADFVSGRRSILLATDAGGEGLNLHQTCRLVVNLELPWNPMRLEQRIGRVDRIGQRRTVHAVHLIAADTAEPRILDRLNARVARAAIDLSEADRPGAAGHDEERAVAHLVVLGVDSATPAPANDDPVPRVMPDLREEAAREVRRLRFARLLENGRASVKPRGSPAEAGRYTRVEGRKVDRPWICRARRAALRAALGRRVLMLWHVAGQDGCGRTLDSALVPVLVELTDPPRRWASRTIDDLCRHIESHLAADTRIRSFESDFERTALALLSTRLSREKAIQVQTAPPPAPAVQRGLFDRRAERAHRAAAAARAEAERDRRDRLASLERAVKISMQPPRLVLVLVP